MDSRQRLVGIWRKEHVCYEKMQEIIRIENDTVHNNKTKQLVWYGHGRWLVSQTNVRLGPSQRRADIR